MQKQEEKKLFQKNVKTEGWNLKKISTKRGQNDTTLRCHNMTPQSSYGLPSRHVLTFYFCCGIVMDEEEEEEQWRMTPGYDATTRYHNPLMV